MAGWMDRATTGIVPMGGEGADWIGQAPFVATPHVFQNLGDGTFVHSGHLAIRQAVAAGANITYKILYNDAVAMTGGQPTDAPLTVPQIAALALAEGAARVAVVAEDPRKYRAGNRLPSEVITLHHRDALDAVQRELREVAGVTVLIYDQVCATEARRRRKRAQQPSTQPRVIINELVCEGCGDCQRKSNCLSVVPVDTEFGRKRAVQPSSCNADLSCINGFCPSFVTIPGAAPERRTSAAPEHAALLRRVTALKLPDTSLGEEPFELLVAGVGGTGVVTAGALVARAAHLHGLDASLLDFTGFAQKGGQVLSHVRIAGGTRRLNQSRIDSGRANTVIAADLVVAASADALASIAAGRTRIVANRREIQTGAMLRDPDTRIDVAALETLLVRRAGAGAYWSLDAQGIAERLQGDAIQANVVLLGYAWQQGLVPLPLDALDRAIEQNGVGVDANRRAFAWGRLAAAEPDFVAAHAADSDTPAPARGLDEIIARRVDFLRAYQDARYAERYRARVEAVRRACAAIGGDALPDAVARNLFKLMSYKDEYEVARLHTATGFLKRIARDGGGKPHPTFYLAPPLLSRPGPDGEPRKIAFGPWILPVFRLLAAMRRLRGTALDPFGYLPERRQERQLIAEYESMLDVVLAGLSSATLATALELAALPAAIRGFGPVKQRAIAAAAARRAALLARLAAEARSSTERQPNQPALDLERAS
jgi:indolepyruvate ferredoxin oxidoreductase